MGSQVCLLMIVQHALQSNTVRGMEWIHQYIVTMAGIAKAMTNLQNQRDKYVQLVIDAQEEKE